MLSLICRNINEAFSVGMMHFRMREQDGSLIEAFTRGQRRLQYPMPIVTTYQSPMERVLFDANRDANPFFHFMESLWIIAGRSDVKWLAQWLPSIANYSDDGIDFHGAYGWRLKNNWQVGKAVERLRKDPDTTRAVLAIYDGEMDSDYDGKDMPCLAGDTILWSPEGDMPISELAKKFKNKEVNMWPVYSVAEKDHTVRLSWATKIWKSGRKKTKILTFDDGSNLRLTDEHVLYVRGRAVSTARPTKVKDLNVGDRLLATHRTTDPKGYELFKRELGRNTAFSNMVKTHKEYAHLLYGQAPDGHVVHHLNEVKSDNREVNLQYVHESDHNSIHRMGDNNPMRKLTPEQHQRRAVKQSKSLKSWWSINKPTDKPRQKNRRAPKWLPDNHVIVDIQEGVLEDVYDFTVPGDNTAIIGTGVVAHNCNCTIFLGIQNGKLNLTVANRSNDMVWGAYGANVVQFSMVQEYIAGMLGVGVGWYSQMSNNAHIYPDNEATKRVLAAGSNYHNPYDYDNVEEVVCPYPMSITPDNYMAWSADLIRFMMHLGETDADNLLTYGFFQKVAIPMARAHAHYRAKNYVLALNHCAYIEASDWRKACVEWLLRRKAAAEAKQ